MRKDNVICDIRTLDCDAEFHALNFEPVEYRDTKGEMRPEYLMPRLGFSVLTMNTTELGIVIEAAPCGVCLLPDV